MNAESPSALTDSPARGSTPEVPLETAPATRQLFNRPLEACVPDHSSDLSTPLRDKISQRTAKVGILGLGYVGLPLALEFSRKGFFVSGFDVNGALVRGLNEGRSGITDVPSDTLRENLGSGRFRAASQFEALRDQDVIIICVPTPLGKSKEPDVNFILSAAKEIARHQRRGQLVILESTTYPGTTRELVLPLLSEKGFKLGRDFHLAFSPERVDPGNKNYRISNTPKVVGGLTPACTRLACDLYSQILEKVVPVSSAESAEMVKLLENTFRAVNIAMVNEMALMCNRLGLNVWEIISAASTKPFGFMPFFPGPGIGGHCIPLDPYYLAWKMKAVNFEPRFIELAGVINSSMPEFVIRRISDILNRTRKSLNGSSILVLGVAYKPDVGDVRESPALDVMNLLLDRGAQVFFHDPMVPPDEKVGGGKPTRLALTAANVRDADIVVIATAHSSVDYSWVLEHSKVVFDTRNVLEGVNDPKLHRL